jgi:protocatechuate 3,4-dioxygenase beta subunit
MKRSEFLKGAGLMGASTILSKSAIASNQNALKMPPPACILTPAVPEGPYYFNTNLLRKDLAEGRAGVPITYNFLLVDKNCNPFPNVIVDIWQCDKDGIYSAYSAQGTAGQTFLRGALMTDNNGKCAFTAIYPGWYNGRLTHLHAKLRLANNTFVTTNFFYPDAINQEVYSKYANIYTKGQNPTTIARDIELKGDTARFDTLLMDIKANDKGGYDANFTAAINATVTAVEEATPEVSNNQFLLHQNFPNPMQHATNVKFSLLLSSRVSLEVFDLMGGKVATVLNDERMSAGEHIAHLDRVQDGYAFQAGNYVYQLSLRNTEGIFKKAMVLSVV